MGIISGCRSTMWNPRSTRRCYVRGRGRPEPLYALVKIKAAQLNGCAYCLDTRNRDARAGGEDQRRLDVLSVPQSILVTRAWCRAQAVATINVWNHLA